MDFAAIDARVRAAGLVPRGGFHPAPDDGVPGAPATLVLAGDLGGAFWPRFRAEARDEPDPLDAWTRRVLGAAAADLGARALYPFDGPPYHPFQRWAMRAEGLKPSPVGPLMHPAAGLWHHYRGALAFSVHIDLPPLPVPAHACDACGEKPCLSACPVGAFAEGRPFDLAACLGHLRADAASPCRTGGCLARRACPVAPSHAYGADQRAFIAAGFFRAFAAE